MSDPVVIVGAGLSGLICANELHRNGIESLLLEASDSVGGRVRTDNLDGFQLDRGFQVLLTAYPEAARQLDYEALQLRTFEPGSVISRRESPLFRRWFPGCTWGRPCRREKASVAAGGIRGFSSWMPSWRSLFATTGGAIRRPGASCSCTFCRTPFRVPWRKPRCGLPGQSGSARLLRSLVLASRRPRPNGAL